MHEPIILIFPAQSVPQNHSTLLKVTVMRFSGAKFGLLVRVKRGEQELSQDDLASKTGHAKAYISNLELGKIPSPRAKTIQHFCDALGITPTERLKCQDSHGQGLGSGLPQALTEKLARKFGDSVPPRAEEQLGDFLLAKALDAQAVRARLTAIAVADSRISTLLNAAEEAIGRGDLVAADRLLASAENGRKDQAVEMAAELAGVAICAGRRP